MRDKVDEVAKLMAELATVRGPAFYGYERGILASRTFKENYAKRIT